MSRNFGRSGLSLIIHPTSLSRTMSPLPQFLFVFYAFLVKPDVTELHHIDKHLTSLHLLNIRIAYTAIPQILYACMLAASFENMFLH